MTLSGGSDSEERREAAREARRARQEWSEGKRPWLFPLLVGIAIAGLVFVIFMVTVVGVGR
jgi:hypothetical protein